MIRNMFKFLTGYCIIYKKYKLLLKFKYDL